MDKKVKTTPEVAPEVKEAMTALFIFASIVGRFSWSGWRPCHPRLQ